MGQAKRKQERRDSWIRREARCIYCAAKPTTVDHMPPICMFEGRRRPIGFEFAACEACNVGTKACDALAGLLAHVHPYETPPWQMASMKRLFKTIKDLRPDLAREIATVSNPNFGWIRRPSGLVQKVASIDLEGPAFVRHMKVFSAKISMALYREHIGEPLPLKGATYSQHFLNSGLTQAQADNMLSIMPNFSALRQGRWDVSDQFSYRYNTDEKSIVASMVRFHGNLHILTFATSEPEVYGQTLGVDWLTMVQPGEFQSILGQATP